MFSIYIADRIFSGSFDVYNIETALPKLDIDAIENHLRAAKEAERRVSISSHYFYIMFGWLYILCLH